MTDAPEARKAASFDLLGPLQVEVMELVWASPAGISVPETHNRFNTARAAQGRPALAYTTILTVLRNLFKRGYCSRKRGAGTNQRADLYTAAKSRQLVVDTTLRQIASAFFQNNISAMAEQCKVIA